MHGVKFGEVFVKRHILQGAGIIVGSQGTDKRM